MGLSLRVLRALWAAVTQSDLDLIAAGVAFYAIFAIFPAVAAVVALFGFVADPVIVQEQLVVLRGLVPPEAYGVIETQVQALIATSTSTLRVATLISIAAALWSTRAGVSALVRGLNTIYGTAPRTGLAHVGAAVLLTLALVALAICALLVVIVAPALLALLPLAGSGAWALEVLRLALMVLVSLAGTFLLYRFGPNHGGRPPERTWPGSVFALLVWGAASWGFSLYVASFGSFNQVYGSIGAVIILLFWFYLSAYALLLGAAVNRAVGWPRGRDGTNS